MEEIDLSSLLQQNSQELQEGFGMDIRSFRSLFNFSQTDFANLLCAESRTTIASIEKESSIQKISTDSLFRLFFFFDQVIDTANLSQFIYSSAKDIKASVKTEIIARQKKLINKSSNSAQNDLDCSNQ